MNRIIRNKIKLLIQTIIVIICLYCTILQGEAVANEPQPIYTKKTIRITRSELHGMEIGKKVEIYEDKSGRLKLQTLLERMDRLKFEKSQKTIISKGFNTNPVWIKFTIENTYPKNDEFLLEIGYHLLDDIQFYVPIGDGEYDVIKAGDLKPFYYNRKIKHPNFFFQFSQSSGKRTYFLRVQTTSSLSIPLYLWTKGSLSNKIQMEYIFRGIFYGILLIMLFYNLFIFFFTSAKSYFFYVLFILALLCVTLGLDGMGFTYVWPNNPWWNNSLGFFMPLTDVSVFALSMVYLKMMENTPKLSMGMLAFIAIYFTIALLSFFLPYSKIIRVATALQAIGILYLIYVGIFYVLKRNRMALYFVPANIVMLIGVGLSTLKASGTLHANFLTIWGFQLGTGLQAVLFSLGLADRLNQMKNILQNMNILLERKVEERTEELSAAMEEMKAMNTELIDTRDQLWGEMQLAKKIQTVLLPQKPKIEGYSIEGYMQAADEVGGDYYDVINAEGYDWVVIGDVSGHGVPAGLIMMMVQTAIHVALKQKPESDPSDLLIDINQIITENINLLSESKYMTITVFAALKDGKFVFSGLHQDFFIYRNKTQSLNIVETSGIWLGLMEDISGMLNNYSVEIFPGDAILLYTDGVTEATDKDDNMYSDEKLMEIFQNNGHLSPEEIKNNIVESLEGYNKTDDVTFLIIKRN